MYLIGYDLGTSSVKASLLDAESQKLIASATYPKKEMPIGAPQPGWAEQNPGQWWENLCMATQEMLSKANVDAGDIQAIGITYQMHGLVLVDKDQQVLRPSIIWCDSRAVEVGKKAAEAIGAEVCLKEMLNLPGNFTASKLAWVRENEPEVFKKINKMMLPGDYIVMRMTGKATTTASGLSEGILWNFADEKINTRLMEHYGIEADFIPEIVDTFGIQATLDESGAKALGLRKGTPVTYRAGDQPNNALSLNVLEPGQIAATAGTSGVIYGIGDTPAFDSASRVNTFAHVNHKADNPRYGVLLCVNGTGILNSWLKHQVVDQGYDYDRMNKLASMIEPGCEGLTVLPFGNGAERTLGNRDIGASVCNLNFNVHNQSHLLRAAQEGIVFALCYGLDIMKDMGVKVQRIRAGHANMFLSDIFSNALSTLTDSTIELYDTDGSLGAARGAGVGCRAFTSFEQAFRGLGIIKTVCPHGESRQAYADAYQRWLDELNRRLG